MTGGSQRRVTRISSRNDAASAQEQVIDPPDLPVLVDDALLPGSPEVKVAEIVSDLLARTVDAADCTIRISNLFTCNLAQMALVVQALTRLCVPDI